MAAAANMEIIAKRMDFSLSRSTTKNVTFFEFAHDFIGRLCKYAEAERRSRHRA